MTHPLLRKVTAPCYETSLNPVTIRYTIIIYITIMITISITISITKKMKMMII